MIKKSNGVPVCSHPVKFWRAYGQNDKGLHMLRCEVKRCNQYHNVTPEVYNRIKGELIPEEITIPKLQYDGGGYPIR
jgi:hypothetical protein